MEEIKRGPSFRRWTEVSARAMTFRLRTKSRLGESSPPCFPRRRGGASVAAYSLDLVIVSRKRPFHSKSLPTRFRYHLVKRTFLQTQIERDTRDPSNAGYAVWSIGTPRGVLLRCFFQRTGCGRSKDRVIFNIEAGLGGIRISRHVLRVFSRSTACHVGKLVAE